MRHVAQGFDIVDHRRLAPQAADHREGRLGARGGAFAFQRIQERRLLAADIAAGAAMQMNPQAEIGMEYMLADIALGAGFL